MNPLRILIADDHEMVRRGLKAILAERRGWEICGEADNGRDAVNQVQQLRPDVAILDITMPGLNGLEAVRQIHAIAPQTEILILTMHDSETLVREAFLAGAHGYVLKEDAGRILVDAVESLSQHRPFFTPRVAEIMLGQLLHPESASQSPNVVGRQLTPREREIVQMVAEGRSNKEIAETLRISVRTAETHRNNVLRKLGLHSASDLTRYAIRHQIISP